MADTVFSHKKTDFTKEAMFFGAEPNIARYDVQKYAVFEKLTDTQHSLFWRPQEVDLTKDARDFKRLESHEKFIFLANLKYQILLDSVQGRSPTIALLPYVSIPELEVCIQAWAFFETIHSRAYTHIIRNIVTDPSEIFDVILDDEKILARATAVTKYYDDFIEYAKWYDLLGFGTHQINGEEIEITEYDLMKKLYLCLISVYILEGLRFYVSFACSFAFAELDKMEGNAKEISLIARDEGQHFSITTNIIRAYVQKEGNEVMLQVMKDCEAEVYEMFDNAVQQEKEWAEYLFKDGSMIGLNAKLLGNYVEWMANKRMRALGFKGPYDQPSNPLSWTQSWLSSREKQVAPQETEIESYLIGAIENDVKDDTFSDFAL
jgi:ribonucleoside-diphosphate reductase beta chain